MPAVAVELFSVFSVIQCAAKCKPQGRRSRSLPFVLNFFLSTL